VSKPKVSPPPPKSSARLATTLSVIAIVLSASSWWLNYATSLPAISPKVELIEPLAAGQQIHFKVLLENTGKSFAKQLHPSLAFKFARADVRFEPTYNAEESAPHNWTPTTSDLAPGAHVTLYSINPLSLAHDHDLNAVIAGEWKLYLYGKIRYKDILHISHEVHFCGSYQQLAGADPLKLSYCTSYNETD
jgi:hypothetical protein